SRAVARRPDPVRKLTYRNGRDQFWRGASAKRFHFVRAADGHVCEFSVTVVREVYVIRDRPGIQHCFLVKRWLRAVDLHLADIFQSDPNFVILRRDRDVWRKWT